MQNFFSQVSEKIQRTRGAATFELPILYLRDDAFQLFFSADFKETEKLMPTTDLHPVKLPGGRAVLGVAAFNYIETTIGPYGEVGIVVPVVHGKKPVPALPLLRESSYPGFGVLVLHLPVTRLAARDAGRGEWGYTKFVADMHFSATPEFLACRLEENGKLILDMNVSRRGRAVRDTRPLITYSTLGDNLLRTVIPQKGLAVIALKPKGSSIRIGDHPVADELKRLGISPKPILSRYYPERFGILPAGEVVQTGVKPLQGYLGSNQEGILELNSLAI